MKPRSVLAGTALILALFMAAAPAASAASVSMVDFSFSPQTVTISVGQSVTWTNAAGDPHTSTSDDGLWDSGPVNPGQSFTHTFNAAGTFRYHCAFHQSLGMVGTVVVLASGGGGSGPLPNTGSSTTGSFLWLGVTMLVAGAAVLVAARRRRA